MHSSFCGEVPSIINVQFWFGAQDTCSSVDRVVDFRVNFKESIGGYEGKNGPLEVFCVSAPPNETNQSILAGAVYEACQVNVTEFTDPDNCSPLSIVAYFSIDTPCCPEIIAPSGVRFYDGIPIPNSPPPPENPLCYDCKGDLVPCSEIGGGCGESCPTLGSPSSGSCNGSSCGYQNYASSNPVRYSSGEIIVRSRDLEVSGYGVPWGHTRTFQSRLSNNETIGNGFNWNVEEWPYLVVSYEGTVTVMGRASGSLWFDKEDSTFRPRFNIKHVLVLDSEAGVYRLFAPDGTVTEFDDFTGMFRRRTAPGGNSIEVTAMDTNAYNFTEVERIYTSGSDTITEQFHYVYEKSQVDSLLSSVTVRRKINSGAWSNVSRVFYNYYGWNEQHGGQEDLKTASSQQWTGSGWEDTGTTYYRYYKSIQESSSSSSSSGGGEETQEGAHLIKYVINPASYARMIDEGISDPLSATDFQISCYADNYFEYDLSRRATKEVVNGGAEIYLYEYQTSGFSDNYNHWKTKTTETLPDGTKRIVYSNYAGMTMLKVFKSGADEWVEFLQYDSNARVSLKATPAAVSGYDEYYPDLLNQVGENYQYLRDGQGLIRTYTYDLPTGWRASESVQQGQLGDSALTHEFEYIPCGCCNSSSSSSPGSEVYFLSKEIAYPSASNPSETIETQYCYTWHEGTCQVKEKTTILPIVGTDQNGSGTSNSIKEHFDIYGYNTWRMDERGYITRIKYDIPTGAIAQKINDVDTSIETDHPPGWSTPVDGGLNLVTDYEHDNRGRITQALGPVHEIDLNGVATNIRRASWMIYTESASQDTLRLGQGYATGSSPSYSYTLINPVTISISDKNGKIREKIQATRASTAGKLLPSDTFAQSSYTRWHTYQYTNCCQVLSERSYFDIPTTGEGLKSINYAETSYRYDDMKRRIATISPGGTINRVVYDPRGLILSRWIGTNETGATPTDPTGGGASGNNMVIITANQYDNGSAGGDGNLTQSTAYADATDTRVTTYEYDFRNRRIVTDGEIDYYQTMEYDNLNRVLKTERYNTTSTGKLISRHETFYDPLSRVYRTIRYGVDPATGSVGESLVDNTWFDQSGHVIKSLPSGSQVFIKTTYDSLSRPVARYQGYDLDETSYAEAFTVAGDTILEQTETVYDAASNIIETLTRSRYHNAPANQTGALGNPTTTPKARVTYQAQYSDGLGRTIATANYGTNGGTALSRSATIPSRSDIILVSSIMYDEAGNQAERTDPAGLKTQQEYDDAGREITTILNPQASSSSSSSSSGGCDPSEDANITVRTAYNSDGNVISITAENSVTGDQTTQYVYGTTLANSGIASSLLKRKEIYPDSVDASDVILFSYNRLSQQATVTDQNGTVHTYNYDKLGRQTQDRVTTLGTDVDDAVRRIEMTYEVRGMREHLTSYNNPTVGQGDIVNDVLFVYNDFGQLTTDYQSHENAVNPANTPKVQYTYSDGSNNTIRPTALVYPNGRELNYDYGSTGEMDDAASRVASLIDDDGTTHLVDYSYLGRGDSAKSVNAPFGRGFVIADSPQPEVKWTMVDLTGTNDPDTGDIYSGFDRFGRVKDNRWYSYDALADVDRIQYGYSRAGNRIWRKNVVADATGKHFDELYSSDAIQRLKDLKRGTLNGNHSGVSDETYAECWSLDETGNWRKYFQDDDGSGWDLNQSRTANTANEITGISASTGPVWVTPAYSKAGDMTTMPQPADPTASFSATYDAWNRLVKLVDDTTSHAVVSYQYDGAKRRGLEKYYASGILDETRHFYFTDPSKWQIIEERIDSSTDAEKQLTWGLRYIDNILLRDRDSTDNGTLHERLYGLQDANWNVTCLIDLSGNAQERFAYSAYGQPTFLKTDFVPQPSSLFDWKTLFAGYRHDTGTGIFIVRNRALNIIIGAWLQRDLMPPHFFHMSLYTYCNSCPETYVDAAGLMISTSNPYVSSFCSIVLDPGVTCACEIIDWFGLMSTGVIFTGYGAILNRIANAMDCICDFLGMFTTICKSNCSSEANIWQFIDIAAGLLDCIAGFSSVFDQVSQFITELTDILVSGILNDAVGEPPTFHACNAAF